MNSLEAILNGDRRSAVTVIEQAIPAAKRVRELEALFYMVRHLAHLSALDHARDLAAWVIEHGFCCAASLMGDPWLAPLRAAPGFTQLLKASRALEQSNHVVFLEAGGPEILS